MFPSFRASPGDLVDHLPAEHAHNLASAAAAAAAKRNLAAHHQLTSAELGVSECRRQLDEAESKADAVAAEVVRVRDLLPNSYALCDLGRRAHVRASEEVKRVELRVNRILAVLETETDGVERSMVRAKNASEAARKATVVSMACGGMEGGGLRGQDSGMISLCLTSVFGGGYGGVLSSGQGRRVCCRCCVIRLCGMLCV